MVAVSLRFLIFFSLFFSSETFAEEADVELGSTESLPIDPPTEVVGDDADHVRIYMDPEGNELRREILDAPRIPFENDDAEQPQIDDKNAHKLRVGDRFATASTTFFINIAAAGGLAAAMGASTWEQVAVSATVFASGSAMFRYFWPEYQFFSSGEYIRRLIPENVKNKIALSIRKNSFKYGMATNVMAEVLYVVGATLTINLYYYGTGGEQFSSEGGKSLEKLISHFALSAFAFVGIDSGVAKFTRFEIARRMASGRASRAVQVLSNWLSVAFSATHTAFNASYDAAPYTVGGVFAAMGVYGLYLAKIAGGGDDAIGSYMDDKSARYDSLKQRLHSFGTGLKNGCRGFFNRE